MKVETGVSDEDAGDEVADDGLSVDDGLDEDDDVVVCTGVICIDDEGVVEACGVVFREPAFVMSMGCVL